MSKNKTEFLKKQIEALDVKSDEFFILYKIISDKYWTFENPDEFQKSAKTLNMWAERGPEDLVIVSLKIAEQLLVMDKDKSNVSTLRLGFKDREFSVDIYTNKEELDGFMNQISGIHDAMKRGKVKSKNKFWKKYF